jgi:hypothetical protein
MNEGLNVRDVHRRLTAVTVQRREYHLEPLLIDNAPTTRTVDCCQMAAVQGGCEGAYLVGRSGQALTTAILSASLTATSALTRKYQLNHGTLLELTGYRVDT